MLQLSSGPHRPHPSSSHPSPLSLPALREQRPRAATRWRRHASQRPGHFAPPRWAARRRCDASAGPRAREPGEPSRGAEARPQAGGGGDSAVSHPGAPDRPWEAVPRWPARQARELLSCGDGEAGGSPCVRPCPSHTCGSNANRPVAWGSGGLSEPQFPPLPNCSLSTDRASRVRGAWYTVHAP